LAEFHHPIFYFAWGCFRYLVFGAVSPRSFRRRAPGIPAREQAAAEERALQRAIAVHAAAAEAGGFAGRVEPRMISPSLPNTRESRSVSKPPSVLRVRMLSLTAISGPRSGSRMRWARGADQPVADVARALWMFITCASLT
jgi:hypothetical protein